MTPSLYETEFEETLVLAEARGFRGDAADFEIWQICADRARRRGVCEDSGYAQAVAFIAARRARDAEAVVNGFASWLDWWRHVRMLGKLP